jgi:hypothetical protein
MLQIACYPAHTRGQSLPSGTPTAYWATKRLETSCGKHADSRPDSPACLLVDLILVCRLLLQFHTRQTNTARCARAQRSVSKMRPLQSMRRLLTEPTRRESDIHNGVADAVLRRQAPVPRGFAGRLRYHTGSSNRRAADGVGSGWALPCETDANKLQGLPS